MSEKGSPSSSLLAVLSLWIPVIAWCAVIFYFSHQPHLRITQEWWDLIARKIAHMVEYGILAWLMHRALRGTFAWDGKRLWRWSLILTITYALSDEFHQHFIPGRVGSPIDVLIDVIGAMAARVILSHRHK